MKKKKNEKKNHTQKKQQLGNQKKKKKKKKNPKIPEVKNYIILKLFQGYLTVNLNQQQKYSIERASVKNKFVFIVYTA